MEKQPYTKPSLAVLGSLAELTQGIVNGTGDEIAIEGTLPVSP